jgi:peptidoglycan/LPS O-acetylase OafA/YrhL
MPRKTPRLNSLTSLRYFAAAAVVVTHVNPFFLTSLLQREATAYWYVGVSFFFMLSGFVLTWSCSWQAARPFWWNRFSRVWPLQAAMMIIVYATLWDFVTHPPDAVGWILQPFLLQGWDNDVRVYAGGNGPTWSLSCEFFFYAMFPLLIRLVRRLGPRGLVISAAVVLAIMGLVPLAVGPHVSAATYSWLFFYLPAYRIGEFIIGMLLARAVQIGLRFPRASVGYLLGWAWVAAWVVFTTWYTKTTHDWVPRPFATMLVMPGFVLLVLAGASADLAGRARLMNAWLPIKLGEWSFALYLVQDGIISVVTRHVTLNQVELDLGGWLMLVFIAGCTVVAAVAHYAIEKPAERWLRARGPGRRGAPDNRAPDNRRPPDSPRPPGGAERRPEVDDRRPAGPWTGPRHRRAPLPPQPTYPTALQP